MNKRIRSMIDEIFSEMRMTAENLALRDELMANAFSRFEDSVAQGRSEEEAFAEVASSLEDVQGLLEEMNRMDAQAKDQEPQAEWIPELKTGTEEAEQPEEKSEEQTEEAAQGNAPQTDLGEALNKAFTALGDFSQAIMPEARKLAKGMDEATGGMLGKLGRAARKGVRDAQRAAGEAIDRLSGDQGELVFDFGPKKAEKESAAEEAADGNEDAQEPEFVSEAEESAQMEETAQEPLVGADGEIDQDALARAVEDVTREAEQVIHQAASQQESAEDGKEEEDKEEAEYTVRDAHEPLSGRRLFPLAGIREIDIQLDADDVQIAACSGDQIETLWEAHNVDGEPVAAIENHKLVIRRRNPDVFKTFFSVFDKNGGKITICVPRGCALAYRIHTTSGDVLLRGVDAEAIQANTTSGCVRLEPDIQARARRIEVTTVSGHATVSACADDVAVTTVSGDQFIACDAQKVDISAVSGKIHVEGACEEWEISAVSGDAELLCTAVPTKRVQISSMHANVKLALPQDIRGFAAEIKGPLGVKLVNEFGPDRYGTCALPIRMETMRGRLMITRL